MKAIIDTDPGSDVDDLIAIKWFEAIRNTDLKAITTVHADTKMRANLVAKCLDNLSIPIAYGIEKPLVQNKLWIYGHEGKGIIDGTENFNLESNAIDLLYRTIMQNKNNIAVLCIGPLTNIAKLLQERPDVEDYISRFYFMGGVEEKNGLYVPSMDAHNVEVDPEAADIVFKSKVPKTIITNIVSKQVILYQKDFELIKNNGTKWSQYIYTNAQYFMKDAGRDFCYMYDPLTVMSFVLPQLIKTKTLGNISVAVGVDAKKVKESIMDVLRRNYES